MNKSEAERQIEEIFQVVHSGHRLVGSPGGLIASGAGFILIGGIQWAARLWQTGRIGTGAYATSFVAIAVVTFVLCFGGRRFLREEGNAVDAQKGKIHPLITQSFGIANAILFAGVGLTVIWWRHTDRVIVIWAVLMGVLTHLWGRYIHKKVERFSYVLISGAIILAGLSEFNLWTDDLLPAAALYFGLWSIGLGLALRKYQGR